MPDELNSYPVVSAEKVRWGDMDAFQHVNNIKFFQYFESARIEYFARIGFERNPDEGDIGPILAETACRFKRPLTYPDDLQIGVRVTELRKKDMLMEFAVVSAKSRAVVAVGTGRIVSYDYRNNTKTELPASVRDAILQLQPEIGNSGS